MVSRRLQGNLSVGGSWGPALFLFWSEELCSNCCLSFLIDREDAPTCLLLSLLCDYDISHTISLLLSCCLQALLLRVSCTPNHHGLSPSRVRVQFTLMQRSHADEPSGFHEYNENFVDTRHDTNLPSKLRPRQLRTLVN